jgi:hypothetical protein
MKKLINDEVTKFLDKINHPMRIEIEYLRELILSSNNNLSENIKWNGPNYHLGGEDRITLRINPLNKIQVIFHRGAKKKEQPRDKLISDEYDLLSWKENDRAILSFKNLKEIEDIKEIFQEIVVKWIKAT